MVTLAHSFPAAGTIDYEEFLAATVNLNYLEKEDTMFKAFSYFDKDASGFITREELEDALQVGISFSSCSCRPEAADLGPGLGSARSMPEV